MRFLQISIPDISNRYSWYHLLWRQMTLHDEHQMSISVTPHECPPQHSTTQYTYIAWIRWLLIYIWHTCRHANAPELWCRRLTSIHCESSKFQPTYLSTLPRVLYCVYRLACEVYRYRAVHRAPDHCARGMNQYSVPIAVSGV